MDSFNPAAVAVIIGIVRGIVAVLQQYTKIDVTSVLGVVLSLIVGIILGFLHYFGLTIETGIIAALTGTGVYQLAKKVGNS